MDGYEVKVSYSPDDACYVAQIVEFIGCAVDGPTPEAALARLQDAKAEWIRVVEANGYPIPAPRYGKEVEFSETHNLDLSRAASAQNKKLYCPRPVDFRRVFFCVFRVQYT